MAKIKTEGEKLVIRAALLCKDADFQEWLSPLILNNENEAKELLCEYCGIKSRSELATNEKAQNIFKAIDRDYKESLNPVDEIYKDNLSR